MLGLDFSELDKKNQNLNFDSQNWQQNSYAGISFPAQYHPLSAWTSYLSSVMGSYYSNSKYTNSSQINSLLMAKNGISSIIHPQINSFFI